MATGNKDTSERAFRIRLAELWDDLLSPVLAKGDDRLQAAQDLVRCAWKVLDGEIPVETSRKLVRKLAPDSVVFPLERKHEFSTLGDVVAGLLSGRVDAPTTKGRAHYLSGYVAEAVHARLRVSLLFRQRLAPDWQDRKIETTRAIERVLMNTDEDSWPRCKAPVIRAALRALGAPDNLFRNEEFDFDPTE
jgi:hypothetical protein